MTKFTTFEELVALAPEDIQNRLRELEFVVERPDYHPEPNCKLHIEIVTTRLMKTGDINLILAGLFHDIGKRETIRINPKSGYIMTPGHEMIATKLLEKEENIEFVTSLGANIEAVHFIVKNHMKMKQFSNMRKSKQEMLAQSEFFPALQIFSKADSMLKTFEWDSETKEVTQNEKVFERNESGIVIPSDTIDWIA